MLPLLSCVSYPRASTTGVPTPARLFDGSMDRSLDQTFAKVAARFGVKHSEQLIFGTVDRVQMTGFVETFNIYERHPRVVVVVRERENEKRERERERETERKRESQDPPESTSLRPSYFYFFTSLHFLS